MSNTFRVTVMVTTDVESDSVFDAMSSAIDKVRVLIGDDQDGADNCWVTGIASDSDGEYMAYELEN
jgi:hypothetical protein